MATYATYRHVELDNVGYGKKRVLKPPGGGSSDIFGAAPEETSPRRVKAYNQSQLGSALFGNINGTDKCDNGNAAVSPRSNKPGNDSYKRLFGPPDAPPTPNARNRMRSNIPLSGGSSISSLSSGAATSPAKSTASSNSSGGIANGYASNGSNSSNDMTDGNPVTGIGYASEAQKNGPAMQNGIASSNSSSSGEKSNDTSPATAKPPTRTRVPPGGYSSGLW
ncbi:PREDICTED: microtubule-associated protein Jupiter isoform X3 [Wasmannia auropunctata]|uniref:microtubule-associated protein Jupiter isoform X3 n=1 Tax=Wasmannia auropunctata TaxID=64793 RepID=UPI0005EE858C|nr:PREDICTED: microtubule-associated protein Jupiter isoform X3 [Wasmannia auropunctata]